MLQERCSHRRGMVFGPQSSSFCRHTHREPIDCPCAEEEEDFGWVWSSKEEGGQAGNVVLGPEGRQITFNPEYSCGTAAVRGCLPLAPGLNHYWELKMTSAVYGTDIMVGVCTAKCDLTHGIHRFCSLLGRDDQSWGYSYTGTVRHAGKFRPYGTRWGKGSIVGIHLDSWRGSLQYFLNRRPLGTAFTGLANKVLYPIVSSTSAHSGMKLVTACSFPANLQFLASEAVFTHLCQRLRVKPQDLPLPPGLRAFVQNNYRPFLRSFRQWEPEQGGWAEGGAMASPSLLGKHPLDGTEGRTRAKRIRWHRLFSSSSESLLTPDTAAGGAGEPSLTTPPPPRSPPSPTCTTPQSPTPFAAFASLHFLFSPPSMRLPPPSPPTPPQPAPHTTQREPPTPDPDDPSTT